MPKSATAPLNTAPKEIRCQWENCDEIFTDAEVLYNHLCNDHVGRKSTNNLSLTCRWQGCEVTTAKRDHATSHMRVHTPLKPHVCETCKKSFKRPHDLKKHEKIHSESHQAQRAAKASVAAQQNQSSMQSLQSFPTLADPVQQATLANIMMQQQQLNTAAARLLGLPQNYGMPQIPLGMPYGNSYGQSLPNLHTSTNSHHGNHYAPYSAPPLQSHNRAYPIVKEESLSPSGSHHSEFRSGPHSHHSSSSGHSVHSASASPPARKVSISNMYPSLTGQAASYRSDPLPHQQPLMRSTKRSFEEAADELIVDLKKKKLEEPQVNARLDTLSSLLFPGQEQDPAFLTATPAFMGTSPIESSLSSPHSSASMASSNSDMFSPETNAGLSPNEVDNLNDLLFTLGASYEDATARPDQQCISWPNADSQLNGLSAAPRSEDSVYTSTSTQSHRMYPSLPPLTLPNSYDSGMGSTDQRIKSAPGRFPGLPAHQQPSPYSPYMSAMSQDSFASKVSFNSLAPPSRSGALPYISSDFNRDPIYNHMALLQSARPRTASEDTDSSRLSGLSESSSEASLSPGADEHGDEYFTLAKPCAAESSSSLRLPSIRHLLEEVDAMNASPAADHNSHIRKAPPSPCDEIVTSPVVDKLALSVQDIDVASPDNHLDKRGRYYEPSPDREVKMEESDEFEDDDTSGGDTTPTYPRALSPVEMSQPPMTATQRRLTVIKALLLYVNQKYRAQLEMKRGSGPVMTSI